MEAFKTIMLIALFGATSVLGTDKPSWLSNVPKVHYVGRAAHSQSEAEGVKIAVRDIYEQLIKEHFGVTAQIKTETCETLTDTSSAIHFQAISQEINIAGIYQTAIHVESNSDQTFNVWVLARYDRVAIGQEKLRLKTSKLPILTSRQEFILTCEKAPRKINSLREIKSRIIKSNKSIGLGLGFAGSSIVESAITVISVDVTYRNKVLNLINIEIGISGKLGQSKEKVNLWDYYSSVHKGKMSGLESFIGMPIQFTKVLAIHPEIGYIVSKYHLVENEVLNSYSINQYFYGGKLSYMDFSDKYPHFGWSIQTKGRKYSKVDKFKGNLSLGIAFQILYRY